MELVRSNYLKIIPNNHFETTRIEQFLRKYCIYNNPLYEKQLKRTKGNMFFSKVDKYVQTYEKNKKLDQTYFNVMKGNKFIFDEIQKIGLKLEKYYDERVESKIEINNIVEPRDEEQRKAINAILNNDFDYGILSASPAMGKTFTALYCACKLKQRVLILVDMVLLIDQFVDSILKFTDVKEEEIGFIRGQEKSYENKKIVISTIQTLTKENNKHIIDYLADNIGFVICDEVHIMSCETAQNILKHLKPKYMLGLSGTPHRDDKMDFVIMQAIGPIIHNSDRQAMVESGSMMTPLLRPIFLKDDKMFKKYNIDKEIDFRDVVDKYYNSPKAIDKISNVIIHHYKNNDSQLVVCKEMDLIDRYYSAIIKKLFGNDLEEKALKEKEKIIKEIKKEIEIIQNMSILDVSTALERTRYKENLIELEFLEEKYKEKLEKTKNDKLTKLYKKIENIDKKKWIEMPCIKNIKGIDSIVIFTGKANKKERDRVIEETNNGNIKVILTTSLLDKAISISRLNILYLLFSTRERANTIQRIGRISRSYPNKKQPIVYDVIYDHYMSYYQFSNSKGECRLAAYKGYVKVHESIFLLLEYLRARFRQENLDYRTKSEWENYIDKYVIELN